MSHPDTEIAARIVEWNHQKGYGFLQLGQERVFLHRRDFAGMHRRPAIGQKVSFIMGRDARGRSCATNAVQANGSVGTRIVSLLVLIGLLVLPVIAGLRSGVDIRWAAAYTVVLSAVTYAVYALDKNRARNGDWRISEAQLHLLELLGGWPGAWLAQRWLRHKCSKGDYQMVFWLIVLCFQFAAFDSLQNWQLSRAALKRLDNSSQHHR